MKRFIFPVIIALVIALVILAFVAVQSLNSPLQTALSEYTAYLYRSRSTLVQVRQVVPATRPQKYTAEMSGPVLGNSPYYNVDQDYSGVSGQHSGKRALPYPPLELSCVLLGSEKGNSVIYVALHQDMHNAQWLVHESRDLWPSDALLSQFEQVGCAFKSDEIYFK